MVEPACRAITAASETSQHRPAGTPSTSIVLADREMELPTVLVQVGPSRILAGFIERQFFVLARDHLADARLRKTL